MAKLTPELEIKLKNLPTSAGVYLFKDRSGRIIYIGKAKNLRNRVRTYFQKSSDHILRTSRMVAKIADVEMLLTDTEAEALILEANLVHEHHPRYNVSLRDDKHFPYIKVTTNEPFPRVLIVRRVDKDGATYFGPYTSSKGMRRTVSFLTRLFNIRSCNLVIPAPEGKSLQVCLDYRIKRCGGPCEDLQSREDYAEGVEAVLMVLKGKSKTLIDHLTEKMHAASAALNFEEAAEARDQVEALQSTMIKQKVDVGDLIDRDIVALAREGGDIVAIVMQIREGVLIGRQDFQLRAEDDHTDETVLETFVTQYYNHQPNLPDELFLPYGFPEQQLVEDWLKMQRGSRVRIVTPQIGEKVRLVELAARNARLLLDELLIQKRQVSERTSKMVTSLQDALKLTRAPRSIVCFDISNTGETDAVGSAVFFKNAQPRKKEYRHFKIKSVTGQDDFKMMREVVGRYFSGRERDKQPLPDLVVVDGGKGQLSAVTVELKVLGLSEQPAIGLAKRLEEVFLPGLSDPIVISRSSPALMLLKQVRDEAHRFAITYNRKVRTKRTVKSVLGDIKGVGPAKQTMLLKTFGSVDQIRKLSIEELSAVKGINAALAETILAALNGPA